MRPPFYSDASDALSDFSTEINEVGARLRLSSTQMYTAGHVYVSASTKGSL